MRELLLWTTLALAACDGGTGYTGDPSQGPCEVGDAQCVDQSRIQYCTEGSWADAEDCPPEETNVGPIRTYCFEAGFCGPG